MASQYNHEPSKPPKGSKKPKPAAPSGGPVTMRDIGDRCGFHKATVQRVLAGLPGIAEQTRQIILATAKEMGYDPAQQQAARRLAWQKHGRRAINHLIALIMPVDFYRVNFFTTLFHGIMDVLTQERFDLVTIYHRDFTHDGIPYSLARGDVDGVIGFDHPNQLAHVVSTLRNTPHFGKRPFISLVLGTVPECAAVICDEVKGSYLAAAHLLDLGHKHLLHFWGDTHGEMASNRVTGYRQAYLERGLDPDVYLHAAEKIDDNVPFPARIDHPLLQALSVRPEITAVLLPNDPYAVRAREVLAQEGKRVPEDISLIGYDDTEVMPDSQGQNILTTIRVPLLEIGRQAARLMIDQINGQAAPEQIIELTPELIVRGSTAPLS